MFSRVEVRALRRPLKFLHPKLWGIVAVEQKRVFLTLSLQVENAQLSKLFLYAVEILVAFTENHLNSKIWKGVHELAV